MIERVSFARTTFNRIPYRFEAGTPDIAGIHATGVALSWLLGLGLETVRRHEEELVGCALESLPRVPGLRIIGAARARRGGELHHRWDAPQDIGTLLDLEGIAVRTGHHCAMPLHERLGLSATVRASFGVYSTPAEVTALTEALARIVARYR